MQERLHKVLAHCGVGSRRECETIIEQGRVQVNGKVITKLGTKVDPLSDALLVDGEKVRLEPTIYYLLNKPQGFLCTSKSQDGRALVAELVNDDRRIYSVGRLDEGSEGLVLLTNDGDLANIICHPRYQVDKTYRLTVKGSIHPERLEKIEKGVWLPEGKTPPAHIRKVERKGPNTIVTVTLWEGRNRELRRMFAKVELRVLHLVRTAIGPLGVDGLPVGSYRRVDPQELGFVRERMTEGWRPKPIPRPDPERWRSERPARGRPSAGGYNRGPRRDSGPAPRGDRGPRRAPPRGP